MTHRKRRTMKPDPIGEPRNSLAVYLLALCTVSGLANLLGIQTTNAINEALGPVVEKAWGTALLLGAGTTLLGMFWQGKVINGLSLKRWGMYAVTVAAVVYTGAIIWVAHLGGSLFAGFVAGLAIAAYKQYRKIRRVLDEIKEASP